MHGEAWWVSHPPLSPFNQQEEEAKKFAEGLNDVRLVLIDGVDLAKLMIDHSVGVQVKETIRVAKIDQDFFSGDE